jgi:formylglycine-generating enzyme required for sulfatase activity
MGARETEAERYSSEGPRHRVRIGYAFAVSKYPITVGEFARFVADSHYDGSDQCRTFEGDRKERGARNWRRPGFDQTNQTPATCLNWNDAKAYTAWLSRKTGHAYRLLSEVEYEYANRAGATTAYWWGDDIGKGHANCDGCGSQWDKKQTSPVGSFQANPLGLYDMSGNAWSWVSDCWNETYSGAPTDGTANTIGDCGQSIIRGGSWFSGPAYLRADERFPRTVGIRGSDVGFRLARTL